MDISTFTLKVHFIKRGLAFITTIPTFEIALRIFTVYAVKEIENVVVFPSVVMFTLMFH